MDDIEYKKWEDNVNSHPELEKRDKIVLDKNKISSLRRWNIIKDIIILVFIIIFILLFSIPIFFPDNYKGIITATHICDPIFNITTQGDKNNLFNNFTCQCENSCNFPDKLRIEIINST